jgi:hypothetical protein
LLVLKFLFSPLYNISFSLDEDESYNEEQAKIKAEKDKKVFSSLTEEDKSKIREDAQILKERQEEVQGTKSGRRRR